MSVQNNCTTTWFHPSSSAASAGKGEGKTLSIVHPDCVKEIILSRSQSRSSLLSGHNSLSGSINAGVSGGASGGAGGTNGASAGVVTSLSRRNSLNHKSLVVNASGTGGAAGYPDRDRDRDGGDRSAGSMTPITNDLLHLSVFSAGHTPVATPTTLTPRVPVTQVIEEAVAAVAEQQHQRARSSGGDSGSGGNVESVADPAP